MSYIAIKNFSVNEKKFEIGDPIPTMFVEDRLIRSKKIALSKDISQEDTVINTVEESETNIEVVQIEELKEVVQEVQETEELLIEDSSNVEVKIEEVQEVVTQETVKQEEKISKKSKTKSK